ncbi:OsmC family peroxiredoxin [Leptobacterium flavescens]|uniref:OsmC family peroxiredoxin n=1 Tax=Leptobacterium flavescens TaxID=472055 RepID=A0A6P0UKV8_9FLAO|nr:OsmC family protein [Leptobacterium flavescens]NER12528.1 OsmC family peroxiredoxin [Leptobacterium flavescens]
MKIYLDRIDDDFLFEVKNENGHKVLIDNKSKAEGEVKGASPMEILLMGVAGCSGIDIVSILKKQRQEITSYHVETEGQREKIEDATPFTGIHTKVFLEGNITEEKAKRAAQLSFDKYCSVSKSLDKNISITFDVILNGKQL